MTEPYTPTTAEVRAKWIGGVTVPSAVSKYVAEFDRWLATELATAERTGAEKALRDAADFAQQQYHETMEGIGEARVTTGWLRARADALTPSERKSDQ